MGIRSYPLLRLVLASAVLAAPGCGDSTVPGRQASSTDAIRALESIERLMDAGRTDEALRAAEACARARPDDPLAAEMLGRALLAANASPQSVADAYARAADLRPDSPGLQSVAGITATRAGRSDAAIERLKRACALEPGNPQHSIQLAIVHRTAGQMEAAADAARRAVGLAPLEPACHLSLAQTLLALNRGDDAAASARLALECAPSDRGVRREVAEVLIAAGQANTAMELVVVSARARDAPPEEIETLARALRGIGRDDLAAAQWERLASAPTRPWRPCVEAASCHAAAGRTDLQMEWLARARERGAPPDALPETPVP